MATWMRPSCEALGLSTGGRSTVSNLSRRPVPSACSAYIGWKQPAVSAASAAMAKSLMPMPSLADDIDDPFGHNDHLADGVAAQGLFYRIERQNGSLNLRILGRAWHRDVGPVLPSYPDHPRHGV